MSSIDFTKTVYNTGLLINQQSYGQNESPVTGEIHGRPLLAGRRLSGWDGLPSA